MKSLPVIQPQAASAPSKGTPLQTADMVDDSGTSAALKPRIVEALSTVFDPEIPVNVVDLGLVYDLQVDGNDVDIKMTLTFAGCGMGPYIAQQAEWRVAEIETVDDVNVEMIYEPPWTPDLISEDGKKQLGLD